LASGLQVHDAVACKIIFFVFPFAVSLHRNKIRDERNRNSDAVRNVTRVLNHRCYVLKTWRVQGIQLGTR
jgi:hypothetical protein